MSHQEFAAGFLSRCSETCTCNPALATKNETEHLHGMQKLPHMANAKHLTNSTKSPFHRTCHMNDNLQRNNVHEMLHLPLKTLHGKDVASPRQALAIQNVANPSAQLPKLGTLRLPVRLNLLSNPSTGICRTLCLDIFQMLTRTQNASNTNRTDTVIQKMSHYFLGYIMSDLCFGFSRPFCIPGLPLHEVCLNVHGCALSILRQQNDQHGQAAMTMLMATISAVPCKN